MREPPTGEIVTVNHDRFDRSIRALTKHGQRKLAATHVAVVGVGGLGSCMAEQLARYGVLNLTLIDPDEVEESNLPRLFGAYAEDIGRPKVTVLKEHLHRIHPDTRVEAVQRRVEDAADVLDGVDLIIAGLDQVSPRLWLNQYAVRHELPYIDAGVIITTDDERVDTMEGYIQRIVPGVTACFDCLNRGDREQARIERLSEEEQRAQVEQGYIEESALSPEPAVIPLNGVVASKAVQEAAKHITGYAKPADYIAFEGVANTLDTASTTPTDRCATCGDHGMLGRGDTDPEDIDIDPDDYSHLDL